MKARLCFLIILGLLGCSDSEYYKVQFDNVDRLSTGDKVYIKGLEVGEVKELTVDGDRKVLAIIWVGRSIKLTKDSKITIKADPIGTRFIEVDLSDSNELLNPNDVHVGHTTTADKDSEISRTWTKEQHDSLVRSDSSYALFDTIYKTLKVAGDNLGKKKTAE